MDRLRVRLVDLHAAWRQGVNVRLPLGTRHVHYAPTLAAGPVEVFPGGVASVGGIADGRFAREPGVVMRPGSTLHLDDGVSYLVVRAVPGLGAGFSDGETPLDELDRWSRDWDDGSQYARYGFGPSHATTLATASSELLFIVDGSTTDNAPVDLGPVRVAALRDPDTERPCVSNVSAAAPLDVLLPHAVVPGEVVRRYARARLHVRVGAAFDDVDTAEQLAASLLVDRLYFLGAYADLDAQAPQDPATGSVEFWLDVGSPAEVWDAFSSIRAAGSVPARKYPHAVSPSVAAEWILDDAPSTRGKTACTGRLVVNELDATQTRSLSVYAGASGVARVAVAAVSSGDAEVRAWRVWTDDGADTTSAPALSAPLSAAGDVVEVALGPGHWCVGIYAGTGTVSATLTVDCDREA